MSELEYVAAIEICSSKIIGAVGKVEPNRQLTILAVEQEECTDIVRYGIIQNPEEVSVKVNRIIEKLNRNKHVSPRKIRNVYVGLTGRSIRSIMSDVKIMYPEQTEVTEEVLKRLRDDARTNAPLHNLVVLDVIPRSYVVDKMETSSPKGAIGKSISASFDIITCRKDLKTNVKKTIDDKLHIGINGYIATAVAAGNLILSESEKQLGCMLVDFGAETTTVSIYRKGSLCYLATLPLGGRNITRDITTLSVLEERAEEIKRSSGRAIHEGTSSLTVGGIKLADVNNLVVARAEEIVTNVIHQIFYAGLKEKELPGGIICIGAASNLGGLIELIESQSSLSARMGHLPASVVCVDSKAKRIEAIQIASILAAGAAIGNKECLEPPQIDEYGGEDDFQDEPDTDYDVPEQPRRGSGLISSLRNKFSKIFAPPEDEQELD